ncbi:hypothetical protein [Tropicimonas sp. IMCC34043]|uniref:hypothetical protein n=1 Tax=Tropicimonas sp. IMCC34043 TaxID=2248760 RepID=UPI000E25132C|nr:hypothetical protein [Tropicimonas sp. IMCC34043]
MTDDPVDLDARRTSESKIAAASRRQFQRDLEDHQEALRKRQEELEAQLLAEPAADWQEAATKAWYLICRYAETTEAQDARRQQFIQCALGDLARLLKSRGLNP